MDHTCTHDELAASKSNGFFDQLNLNFGKLALLFRRMTNRRHLASLHGLSDQQLMDIGLYRDDLHEVAALGLTEDVTTQLAQVARQRRQSIDCANY